MVLGEGLAESAEMIDLAMVLGTGWAPHRGGPLRYADERGPAAVVEALSGLAARHGRRFEACPGAEEAGGNRDAVHAAGGRGVSAPRRRPGIWLQGGWK